MIAFAHSFFLRDNSPLLTLPNGKKITQDENGFYCVSELWIFSGKKGHWMSSKDGKTAIAEAEKLMDRKELYRSRGCHGTYIHPILVLSVAKWADLYKQIEPQIAAAVKAQEDRDQEVKDQKPKKKVAFNLKRKSIEIDSKEPIQVAKKVLKIPRIAIPSRPVPPKEVTEVKNEAMDSKEEKDPPNQLVKRDNSNDPTIETPLEAFQEKMSLMDFARWALVEYEETVDESFIGDYISLYVDMSWQNKANSRCIEIEKLVTIGSYSNRNNARKNMIKYGFREGKDYSIEDPDQVSGRGGHNKIIVYLTPNCFRRMCMAARGETARKIHGYYATMEDIVHEYSMYEKEYNARREEFFRSGMAGNSQVVDVIKDLRRKLTASDGLAAECRKKYKNAIKENKDLRVEIRVRDERISGIEADQKRLEDMFKAQIDLVLSRVTNIEARK